METPIFYRVKSALSKIPPRQQQACLKKITRLMHQAAQLERAANTLSQQCRRWGIAAPNFSAYALKQWGNLLGGLEEALTTKNRS